MQNVVSVCLFAGCDSMREHFNCLAAPSVSFYFPLATIVFLEDAVGCLQCKAESVVMVLFGTASYEVNFRVLELDG